MKKEFIVPVISDTAYQRLAKNPSDVELSNAFTPTNAELHFAASRTRSPVSRLALLLYLKTFQRTGYFTPIAHIPAAITRHIASRANLTNVAADVVAYDASSYRSQLKAIVREFLGVPAYDAQARRLAIGACLDAAATRDDLPDIINTAIEKLLLHRYELPAFDTLMKIARTARNLVNRRYHRQVAAKIPPNVAKTLHGMAVVPAAARTSAWDLVKDEPKRPTVKHLREFIRHSSWLKEHVAEGIFADVPGAKLRQFAAEAATLNANDLLRIRESKRLCLMAALIQHRANQGLDALAQMFIRMNHAIHNHANEALERHRKDHAAITDGLVARLHHAILTCSDESLAKMDRFKAVENILLENVKTTLEQCESHAAIAGDNYLPFLPRYYKSQRPAFLAFLEHARPLSTSQDRSVEEAITFLLLNRHKRTLDITEVVTEKTGPRQRPLLDMSFVGDKWWGPVTGQKSRSTPPATVDRVYFELCLFAQIVDDLKSGDLHIPGSEEFADYWPQLISEAEYKRDVTTFCEQIGFPATTDLAVSHLKDLLTSTADKVRLI